MIAFVSCGSGKQNVPKPAIELYNGLLFRQKLNYLKLYYPSADIYIKRKVWFTKS